MPNLGYQLNYHGWHAVTQRMKGWIIALTTGGVLAYLTGGLALWVHHAQLAEYVKHMGEPRILMDGFERRAISERTFRLMNYIHDVNAVEFED